MENILKDKRFKHAVSDSRFKKVPWKERKVKIDKRFQSMFTDKRFQIKYAVDERGRQVDESQVENYKKYYNLSDSSVSDSESDEENEESNEKHEESNEEHEESTVLDTNSGNDVEESVDHLGDKESTEDINKESDDRNEDCDEVENRKKEKLKEAHKKVNKYVDEIHKQKLNSEVRDKLTDFRVDYARGIGVLVSDSSSDEPSSDDESEEVHIEHPWGEFDKDAEETNEVTSRLAVCNMDWDRVNANDLMVLLHSFLPPDGVIESVTIYPSEFGLARMAEEELKGPKELVEMKQQTADFKESDEAEEGSTYHREKLREYQLKRLKYYYAVIVCNSKETANALYTECDGMEYESSALKLDLRFVGEDVTFEQKPHDTCTALPDLKKYKPRLFITKALQQGKVDLTWDETNPDRIDFSKRLLDGEEFDDDDLKAYVANSSTEEEEETRKTNETESDGGSDKEDDRIKKYRSLVANLEETKSKKRGDVEMEVTWGVDASSKENAVIDSSSSDNIGTDGSSEDEDMEDTVKMRKTLKNKKKGDKKYKEMRVVSAEDQQKNAELELLLADDNPVESGLKHFSLKEIQKKEKLETKKKKWRKNLKKKSTYQEEDSFKMNPSDERFSAIYTSHQFNIDPADPHFRKTKGMEQLIVEKQKRRKLE